MLRRVTSLLAGLSVTALAATALAVPTAPALAGTATTPQVDERRARPAVATRGVAFEVANRNETSVPCVASGEQHTVRGRLVGPRRAVLGKSGVLRVNVLVHDAGTGAWFWNMRRTPAVDYATRLARRGETSLVLDRLGYDRSPLPNGDATCLGAQAQMLHQVVQHLYAGKYVYTGGGAHPLDPPHAAHVVVHGHGTGATVAQLEAAEFDDTAGLVLMSAPTPAPKQLALSEAARQSMACLTGDDYAAYGETPADFRRLLFASATPAVRKLASRQRNATPCGDVTSLLGAVTSSTAGSGKIEVPVLLLTGARDARVRALGADEARRMFRSSEDVTARIVPGAGSALPLEARAGQVRRTVLRWLDRL
ncbi:alpha/beta fold hydrolase [Nocardioides sp. SYSU DS0663]|uniref:alpha/beta fold hydrolase n=1 Tax=Nocardioides sp. SYSU DS0663 TaxID=3416445 RepID=UPI003F4C1F5F